MSASNDPYQQRQTFHSDDWMEQEVALTKNKIVSEFKFIYDNIPSEINRENYTVNKVRSYYESEMFSLVYGKPFTKEELDIAERILVDGYVGERQGVKFYLIKLFK